MLFIAILGLSVLIFGGIIANARKMNDLQTSIAQLEEAHEHQIQLKPLLAIVADQQRSVQALELPDSINRPLTFDEIAESEAVIKEVAAAADLRVLSIRPLLHADLVDHKSVRLEVRLLGQFSDLRPFLHELTIWDYRSVLESFVLQATEMGHEMQLVFQLAVL